jgi:hypothetical protein
VTGPAKLSLIWIIQAQGGFSPPALRITIRGTALFLAIAVLRQVPWATATQIERLLARDLMPNKVAFHGCDMADLPCRARPLWDNLLHSAQW